MSGAHQGWAAVQESGASAVYILWGPYGLGAKPRPRPLRCLSLPAYLASAFLDEMLEAGVISLAQLALLRMGIVVGSGLCTWLLYELLRHVSSGWLHLPLAPWLIGGVAFMLTCWLLGRLIAGSGLW